MSNLWFFNDSNTPGEHETEVEGDKFEDSLSEIPDENLEKEESGDVKEVVEMEEVGISMQLMVEGSRAVPAVSRREPLGSHVKLRELTLASISDLTANDLPRHSIVVVKFYIFTLLTLCTRDIESLQSEDHVDSIRQPHRGELPYSMVHPQLYRVGAGLTPGGVQSTN